MNMVGEKGSVDRIEDSVEVRSYIDESVYDGCVRRCSSELEDLKV